MCRVKIPANWSPIAIVLGAGGVIAIIIGTIIYRSDPYYNDTTDPIGIGFTVVGGLGLFVAWIVQRLWAKAYRADQAKAAAEARARAATVTPPGDTPAT
jgi:hypothetical protein